MIKQYLDLAKKLKKLWTIRMMVIPIVDDALVTVPRILEKTEELKIKERIETI